MCIILLSGGSGKRLWPLSNDLRLKQYGGPFEYHEIFEHYDKLPKISFDYEVQEKSKS